MSGPRGRSATATVHQHQQLELQALAIQQGQRTLYLFHLRASQLWKLVKINTRVEDKREGYQRALSQSRVRSIARYIKEGGSIPGAIVVSFDTGHYDQASQKLTLDHDENAGWVIDGQHRLAGAFESISDQLDLDLPVIALLGASIEEQVELFITINREARGVPASLYIDLLNTLPRKKTDREVTEERVADIARRLNSDEVSPFFQRIIFTRTAKAGEIGLVNFARIFRPLITRPSGHLSVYTQPEQEGAINNYYQALVQSFPAAAKKEVFFRTVGFGGVWRAFPLVFNVANTRYKSFSISSIMKVFAEVRDFNFEAWSELGSGSGAETQAGDDLIETIQKALSSDDSQTMSLKLD